MTSNPLEAKAPHLGVRGHLPREKTREALTDSNYCKFHKEAGHVTDQGFQLYSLLEYIMRWGLVKQA